MNRRAKANVKKIEFEPKVQPQEDFSMIKKEEIKSNNTVINTNMKGLYAPLTFAINKKFDIKKSSFILNLPPSLQINSSLVVFEDNSLGIKNNNIIYECDAMYIGDGSAVEIGDRANKIGNVDFILTAYEYEKEILE